MNSNKTKILFIVMLICILTSQAHAFILNSFRYLSSAGTLYDEYDNFTSFPCDLALVKGARLYTNLSNLVSGKEQVFGGESNDTIFLGTVWNPLSKRFPRHDFFLLLSGYSKRSETALPSFTPQTHISLPAFNRFHSNKEDSFSIFAGASFKSTDKINLGYSYFLRRDNKSYSQAEFPPAYTLRSQSMIVGLYYQLKSISESVTLNKVSLSLRYMASETMKGWIKLSLNINERNRSRARTDFNYNIESPYDSSSLITIFELTNYEVTEWDVPVSYNFRPHQKEEISPEISLKCEAIVPPFIFYPELTITTGSTTTIGKLDSSANYKNGTLDSGLIDVKNKRYSFFWLGKDQNFILDLKMHGEIKMKEALTLGFAINLFHSQISSLYIENIEYTQKIQQPFYSTVDGKRSSSVKSDTGENKFAIPFVLEWKALKNLCLRAGVEPSVNFYHIEGKARVDSVSETSEGIYTQVFSNTQGIEREYSFLNSYTSVKYVWGISYLLYKSIKVELWGFKAQDSSGNWSSAITIIF